MTTTQQPLALKLAEAVKTHEHHPQYKFYGMISDELCRLHYRGVELEADLQLANQSSGAEAYEIACEEMEAYQLARYEAGKEIGTQGSLIDGMAWVYEALDEAESQLEAIGAGGVESLRKKEST